MVFLWFSAQCAAVVPALDVLKSFLQSLRQSPSALLPGLLSHEAVEEFPVQLCNKGLGSGWDGSFMGVLWGYHGDFIGVIRFFAWKIGQLDQDPKISSIEKMSDAGKIYIFDGARHPEHQSLASHGDVHSWPKDCTKILVASRCSSSWHQISWCIGRLLVPQLKCILPMESLSVVQAI